MNSPWGLIFQICSETGFSYHDVMWKVSKVNLMMMMADRPQFKKQPKRINDDEFMKMLEDG